jgi:hypothetical protein
MSICVVGLAMFLIGLAVGSDRVAHLGLVLAGLFAFLRALLSVSRMF